MIGDVLWTPPADLRQSTEMGRFMEWLRVQRGRDFADFDALRRWSLEDLEGFWAAIWDFFNVRSSAPYTRVLEERVMPGARWFPGARLNFAEHMLRHEEAAPDAPALFHSSELRPLERTSWRELGERTRALATALRELGVEPG